MRVLIVKYLDDDDFCNFGSVQHCSEFETKQWLSILLILHQHQQAPILRGLKKIGQLFRIIIKWLWCFSTRTQKTSKAMTLSVKSLPLLSSFTLSQQSNIILNSGTGNFPLRCILDLGLSPKAGKCRALYLWLFIFFNFLDAVSYDLYSTRTT